MAKKNVFFPYRFTQRNICNNNNNGNGNNEEKNGYIIFRFYVWVSKLKVITIGYNSALGQQRALSFSSFNTEVSPIKNCSRFLLLLLQQTHIHNRLQKHSKDSKLPCCCYFFSSVIFPSVNAIVCFIALTFYQTWYTFIYRVCCF